MKKIYPVLTLLFSASLLVACGGGGGGSSTTVSSGGPSYTGIASKAIIDASNANELGEGSVSGTKTGSGLAVATGVVVNGQEVKASPRTLDLANILASKVKRVKLDQAAFLPGAIQTLTGNDPCTNGGTVSYSLQADDVSGAFSGDFSFNSCIEQQTTLSGNVTVSGVVNLVTDDIDLMSMSLTAFTETSGADSYTMTGTVSFTFNGNSSTVTMNLLAQDNNNAGSTEKLENVVITVTDNVAFISMTLSGRYFHPDYGYVDVVTVQPLVIQSTDVWPSQGEFTLSGDVNTSAHITVISNTQYTLEVDTDGNGTLETVTIENWN